MLTLLRFSSSKFLLNILLWNLSYLFSKFELHSFGEELINEKGNFWNTKFDLRKIEKEGGGEISVNFVSKGEASTFARAFELNFFTKAHLHVKDKTRVKGSFFLPRIFNKFKRSFKIRRMANLYRGVPLCASLRIITRFFFKLLLFFYRWSKKQTRLEFHERHIFIFVMSLRLNLSNCYVRNSIKVNIAIWKFKQIRTFWYFETSRDGCSRVTR